MAVSVSKASIPFSANTNWSIKASATPVSIKNNEGMSKIYEESEVNYDELPTEPVTEPYIPQSSKDEGGFKHPFRINEDDINNVKEKIKTEVDKLIELIKLNITVGIGVNIIKMVGSGVAEFLNIGEGLVDGHAYALSWISVDEFYGFIKEDYSDKLEGVFDGWIADIAGDDLKNIYFHGTADWAGNLIGHFLAYAAFGAIPYAGPVVSGFAGAGDWVEDNINKQLDETGCVNHLKVFVASFAGSAEGSLSGWASGSFIKNLFSKGASGTSGITEVFKDGGGVKILKGMKKMFIDDGLVSGIKSFGKSVKPVLKNTFSKKVLTNAFFTQSSAKTTRFVANIISNPKEAIKEIVGDVFKAAPGEFWNAFSSSGLEYFINF